MRDKHTQSAVKLDEASKLRIRELLKKAVSEKSAKK